MAGKPTTVFNYFVYRIFHTVACIALIIAFLAYGGKKRFSVYLFEFWLVIILTIYSSITFLLMVRSMKQRRLNYQRGLPGPTCFIDDPPLLPRNRKKIKDIENQANQAELAGKSGKERTEIKRKHRKARAKQNTGWLWMIWLLLNLSAATTVCTSLGYITKTFRPANAGVAPSPSPSPSGNTTDSTTEKAQNQTKTVNFDEGYAVLAPVSLTLILLEIFTVGFPIRIMHFIYPTLLTGIYIGFSFVMFTMKKKTVLYKELDWNHKSKAIVNSVFLVLFVIAFHILLAGFVHVRDMMVLFGRTMNKQKRIKEQLYKDINEEDEEEDMDLEEFKAQAEKLERRVAILGAPRHLKRSIFLIFNSHNGEFVFQEVPKSENLAKHLRAKLHERQLKRNERNARLERHEDEKHNTDDPRAPLKEWWFENLDHAIDDEKVMGRLPQMRKYPFNFPPEARPKLSKFSKEMLESFGYRRGIPEEHHLRIIQFRNDLYLLRAEPMSEMEESKAHALEIKKREFDDDKLKNKKTVIKDVTNLELDRKKQNEQQVPELLKKAAGLEKGGPAKLRRRDLN